MPSRLSHSAWRQRLAAIALAAISIASPGVAAAEGTPDVAVKAALLFNFAKFTEWPALAAGAPIIVCIVGADGIAAALVETAHGQSIEGHAIEVWRPAIGAWKQCHMLYLTGSEFRRASADLAALRTLPVLSVSDGSGFALSGGIIELYIDGGRMRFAINVNASDRSGLRLSSRLLGLAKVVRDTHDR